MIFFYFFHALHDAVTQQHRNARLDLPFLLCGVLSTFSSPFSDQALFCPSTSQAMIKRVTGFIRGIPGIRLGCGAAHHLSLGVSFLKLCRWPPPQHLDAVPFLLWPLSYFDQGPYCSFQHGSTLQSFFTSSRPRAAPCLLRLCPPVLLITSATCCSGRAPTIYSFCQYFGRFASLSPPQHCIFSSPASFAARKIPMTFLQMFSASRGRVVGLAGLFASLHPRFIVLFKLYLFFHFLSRNHLVTLPGETLTHLRERPCSLGHSAASSQMAMDPPDFFACARATGRLTPDPLHLQLSTIIAENIMNC